MSKQIRKDLKGRTAIITGSGRNIGRAIALAFAGAGMNVVVNGHQNVEAINLVVEEIHRLGARALAIKADVSVPADVERMVADTVSVFGTVDIAVSNVSIRRQQALLDITLEDWEQVIRTNLFSCFYLGRTVLPLMKKRGWGRLIHMSGYDGFTGHVSNRAHNTVSKLAMHGLTKAIAREFGEFGITCNTIVPGLVNTERDWSQYTWLAVEKVTQCIPVGRCAEPSDIASACLYLASDAGSFMNGQALHLNGGEFMF